MDLTLGWTRGFHGAAAEVDDRSRGEPGVAELAADIADEGELGQEIVTQGELGFDGADVVGQLIGHKAERKSGGGLQGEYGHDSADAV
jgi:hypothetical protein